MFLPVLSSLLLVGCQKTVSMNDWIAERQADAAYRQNYPLHWAAEKNDVRGLKRLVNEGMDINGADGSGATALQIAATKGHAAIVEELLGCGAELRAGVPPGHVVRSGEGSMDPMGMAAIKGHSKVVAVFLAQGLGSEANALLAASGGGHEDVVQLILSSAVMEQSIKDAAMYTAAISRKPKTVSLLLSAGADANARIAVEGYSLADTALLAVIRGADVGSAWENQRRQLFETVRLLLLNGADPNATGRKSHSSLGVAQRKILDEKMKQKLVNLLKSHGAR